MAIAKDVSTIVKNWLTRGLSGLLIGQAKGGGDNPVVAAVDELTGAVSVEPVLATPSSATGSATTGIAVRIKKPVTATYDAGPPVLTMTFAPLIDGLSVALSDTGAEAVTYAPSPGGGFITITINGGVSTNVSLAATWAASEAAAVCGVSIDVGTIPGGATFGPLELFDEYTVPAGVDMRLAPSGSTRQTTSDADGKAHVRPCLIPIGAATPATEAEEVVGTWGRIPSDVSLTIDAGMDIVVHPLRGGVSVIGTVGAAASVSASGSKVTLTAKNDGSTTVADMQSLIAASAVSALISISGTATDAFAATWSVSETSCWYEGAIPASVLVALGADGYLWPVEFDSTGGIKVSKSSLDGGEDLANRTQVVEERWSMGSGGVLTASGTAHNAACRIARLIASETGGSASITVQLRNGGSGGTIMTPPIPVPAGQCRDVKLSMTFGSNIYVTITGTGTPSVAVYVHTGGP